MDAVANFLLHILAVVQKAPESAQIGFCSILLKSVIDWLKPFFPKLDGRVIHLVVGLLTIAGAIVSLLMQGDVNNEWLRFWSNAILSALGALGVNEVTRRRAGDKPKKPKKQKRGPGSKMVSKKTQAQHKVKVGEHHDGDGTSRDTSG